MTLKLRNCGLRATRQRLAIACLILDGRHRHVTAEGLMAEINSMGIRIAIGTVYNTLNQFTKVGLLKRVLVHNSYSLFDTNTANHHHFYDTKLNQLIDIPSTEVVLARFPEVPSGYFITEVDVVICMNKK